MRRRFLSTLLVLCMALALFPNSAWAVNEDNLATSKERESTSENELGFREKSYSFAPGETKTFSFTPKSGDGLYIFHIAGYFDSAFILQIESNGVLIKSIYDDYNAYVANLHEGQYYTIKITHSGGSSASYRIAAVRLQNMVDTVSIPGKVDITGHYEDGLYIGDYNFYTYGNAFTGFDPTDTWTTTKYGYLSIKINEDGWYSFFVSKELAAEYLPSMVAVYTETLDQVDSSFCYGALYGYLDEGCAPVSMYLKRGNYIVQMMDNNYAGYDNKSVFQGERASFSTITEVQSVAVSFLEFFSDDMFTFDYVTFAPSKNGTYTFDLNLASIYDKIEKLELFTSNGKKISDVIVEYDTENAEYDCIHARLTASLIAGQTYYLKMSGYANSGGEVSVSLQSETESSFANITRLYPSNGSNFDFTNTSADTRMRIFFDREVASTSGGRAQLDFSKGTLEIRRASDDTLIYEVTRSTSGGDYSTGISVWAQGEDIGAPKTVLLKDATSYLSAGTEYYVTMPAGFIKFVDGTVSPEIVKGTWQFTTVEDEKPIPPEISSPEKISGKFSHFSSVEKNGQKVTRKYNFSKKY